MHKALPTVWRPAESPATPPPQVKPDDLTTVPQRLRRAAARILNAAQDREFISSFHHFDAAPDEDQTPDFVRHNEQGWEKIAQLGERVK